MDPWERTYFPDFVGSRRGHVTRTQLLRSDIATSQTSQGSNLKTAA